MKNESPPMLAHIATDTIFQKNNQILLLRRSVTSKTPGQYSLIGGKCNEGESIVESAIRESYEEVGVRIEPEDLMFVHVVHKIMRGDKPHKDWFFFFFVAERWEGEVSNKEPEKHDLIAWFDLDKLPAGLGETHTQAIREWQKMRPCSVLIE